MRYRPFGRSGMALSNIGLHLRFDKLHKNRTLMQKLIMTALENGINTFHFDTTNKDFLNSAAEMFGIVDRKVLFISLNAHDGEASENAYAFTELKERLRVVIKESGFHWIDMLMFGLPGALHLGDDALNFIDSLRRAKMVRYTGVETEVEDMAALAKSGNFNVLKTTYDIDTTWDKRRQIDDAIAREMCIIATDVLPDAYRKASDVVPKEARRGWFGMKAANPLGGAGTHAFLHQTGGWTPEELCLGYALSQSGLSCILVDPDSPEHLEALADVPERVLPSSVPAQIEMARFNTKRVG